MDKYKQEELLMSKSEKIMWCPMMDKECMFGECGWYNSIINNCSFQSLPYNIYKLNQSLEKIVDLASKPRKSRS